MLNARPGRLARLAAVALALAASPASAEAPALVCGGQNLLEKARIEQPDKYKAFEAAAAKVPNAEGLLWRVSGKAGAPSYLFGTMHAVEDDLVALSEPVRAALKESRSVAVELADASGEKAQAEMLAFVSANGLDPAGRGLDGLSPEQAEAVKARLAETGLPAEIVPMLKPWFLGITMQMSSCMLKQMAGGRPTVDAVVEATGKQQGKTVVGLESMKEQLTAVSSASEDTARRMVRDAVATPTTSDDLQATTLALYRGRKVGWYFAMDKATLGHALDVSSYAEFLEDIVDRRNRLMFERSKEMVEKGGAFIAVGALHMPGPKGLVELFRQAGYQVEKIW